MEKNKKSNWKRNLSLAALVAMGVVPAVNAHAFTIIEVMIANVEAPELNGVTHADLTITARDPATGRSYSKSVASCEAPNGTTKYQCDFTGVSTVPPTSTTR